ncbi:hypothetical protein PINS_up005278 [Pythium insidiosum]|nr:hypothetical protein PINS_up005278 [Pythium insidiosum]
MFPTAVDQSPGQTLGKRGNFPDTAAARTVMHRSASALYVGLCSEDFRLFAWFDVLTATTDAHDQCQFLLDRLKQDDELMSVSLFGTALSMWP